MKVLVIESPTSPELPPLIVASMKEIEFDIEATLGLFLGLIDDQQYLEVGTQVTITIVEMTEEEFEALPEWEYKP